ncbi:unnamed protein product, partial [Prunus brigantina]
MIKKDMPVIEAIAQEQPLEEGGWRKLVKEKISKGNDIKELKDYAIIFGELYRRLPGEMKKQVAEVQANCPRRSAIPSIEESFTISFAEDWKAPYLAFFIDETLPTNSKHARKLKKTNDAYNFMKKCHTGQVHANLSHKPPTLLQDMRTPWPFHTWGLELIRTIHPPSDGYIWILTATEYFTKWVEAVSLRKAKGVAIANFIREYIMCRFRIPYKIVTNNGTPFVNKQMSLTLSAYGVKHRRSTPYYPQGNGQAKATNKTLLRILGKMVYEYERGWGVHLPDALWAYRTSPRSATGFSPYSLVYGSDAISPVEITIPTARVSAVNDLE